MGADLKVQEQRWPDQDGPWVLRLTFGPIDGRYEVVGVELWAVDPTQVDVLNWPALRLKPELAAIHTDTIRLPLRRLLRDWIAGRLYTAKIAKNAPTMPAAWRSDAVELGQAVDVRRKGRADAHGDDHWETVAEVYLSKGTRGVAEHFTVAKGTAAKWVSIARNDKNLLAKTTKGRSSGRSTSEGDER